MLAVLLIALSFILTNNRYNRARVQAQKVGEVVFPGNSTNGDEKCVSV